MTLALAHMEDGRVVVDAIRERRPPFSPDAVVAEFAALLRQYRITTVRGDRYGGEWPRERFRQEGIDYEVSSTPKADLYAVLVPLINSGRIDLPDDPRLVTQLCGLECQTARSGRDAIDHGPGAHDDLANVVAGAAARVQEEDNFFAFVVR